MFPVSERYATAPQKMHRSGDTSVNDVINSLCEQDVTQVTLSVCIRHKISLSKIIFRFGLTFERQYAFAGTPEEH